MYKLFLILIICLVFLPVNSFAGSILQKPKHLTGYIKKVKKSGKNIHVKVPKYSITERQLGKKLNNTVKRKKAKKITGFTNKRINKIIQESKNNSAANSAYSDFQAKNVQKGIAVYLKEMLGSGPHPIKGLGFAKNVPENLKQEYIKTLRSNKPFDMLGGHRIFLVISSSIPFKTLRRYVFQIADNNLPVQMILRGLLPGSHGGKLIIPTVKYITALIRYKGKAASYYDMHVDIDPLVPVKYNINKVPALIYDVNYNPHTFTTIGDKAYVVYGDADLKYGLKQIEEKTHSKYIKGVLNLFKKNQFFNN